MQAIGYPVLPADWRKRRPNPTPPPAAEGPRFIEHAFFVKSCAARSRPSYEPLQPAARGGSCPMHLAGGMMREHPLSSETKLKPLPVINARSGLKSRFGSHAASGTRGTAPRGTGGQQPRRNRIALAPVYAQAGGGRSARDRTSGRALEASGEGRGWASLRGLYKLSLPRILC